MRRKSGRNARRRSRLRRLENHDRKERVPVGSIVDARRPKLPIIWKTTLEIPRFAIPDEAPAAIARTVKIRLLREFESSSLAAAPERSKG